MSRGGVFNILEPELYALSESRRAGRIRIFLRSATERSMEPSFSSWGSSRVGTCPEIDKRCEAFCKRTWNLRLLRVKVRRCSEDWGGAIEVGWFRDKGDAGEGDRRESGTRRAATRSQPVVVFADDSAVQTLKLKELLEEAGYRAVACSDGHGAVRRAEELVPDLILLDLEMPGLSGVEACRTIKKNRALSHVPVLILTAHDEPKYLVAAFDAGCAGYLVKGTPDAILLEKIARHIPNQKIVLKRA